MSGFLLDPTRLPGIAPWVHVLPSLTSAAGVFLNYANLDLKASKNPRAYHEWRKYLLTFPRVDVP
jgi:hypothetical protein